MSADLNWNTTQNDNKNALRTGDVMLSFGDVVEVKGQANKWIVTYVTGSEHQWNAVFNGQDALPLGQLEWRIIYRVPRTTPPSVNTKAPKAVIKQKPAAVALDKEATPSRFNELFRRVIEIVGILLAVIAVIIGLVMYAH